MEKQNLTAEEVLEITIRMMEGIRVPVEYAEEIAIPLKKCANNLKVLLAAVKTQEQQEEQREENPE